MNERELFIQARRIPDPHQRDAFLAESCGADSVLRQQVHSLLEAHGVTVVAEARNGREAVELARVHRPDVVLMDLAMPEMGGLAATRLLTADLPEVAVVVLTASEDDADLFDAVKSGRFKDSGTPHRPMSRAERAFFQELVDGLHEQFVRHVIEARGLERFQVEGVADGRILTGEQALGLGLVDQMGNFRDAVETARALAGLKGEPELVYFGRDRLSWITRWFSESVKDASNWLGVSQPQYLFRP